MQERLFCCEELRRLKNKHDGKDYEIEIDSENDKINSCLE